MNAIIEAVAKIAPDYELTAAQIVEIERNAAPTQTAKNLPGVLQSMAESYANKAPVSFDWRLVPVEWLLDAVDFDRHTTTAYRMDFNAISKMVGREQNFQMGVIAARAEGDNDVLILTAMYHDILGRAPDADGLEWWLGVRRGGMGWGELVPAFLAGVSDEDTVQ